MREYSFLYRMLLSEATNYADISFYEVSPNSIPVLKTDEIELSNVNTKKSLIMKVLTKGVSYPINFKKFMLKLYLNGDNNSLSFNLYSIEVMILRSYAIVNHEPCQVRNEAALSGANYVP